jgi:hypothetical protein
MNTEQQINFTRPVILNSIKEYQEKKQTIGTFSVPLEIEWDSVNQLAKTEFSDWYIEHQHDEKDWQFWAFYNPKDNH